MSLRMVLLVAALAIAPLSGGQAVELSGDYEPARFADRDPRIDPDESVYGVPFGSSVEEVRAAFGAPRGEIIINPAKQGLIYGRSHLFVFVQDRLRQVVVDSHVVHWMVTNEMDMHFFFDNDRWVLGPGLYKRMRFPDVIEALGRTDDKPEHELRYDGARSSTTLRFASQRGLPGAESYILHSFAITHYGD